MVVGMVGSVMATGHHIQVVTTGGHQNVGVHTETSGSANEPNKSAGMPR